MAQFLGEVAGEGEREAGEKEGDRYSVFMKAPSLFFSILESFQFYMEGNVGFSARNQHRIYVLERV